MHARYRRRRNEIPIDDIAERLVDPYAVLKHRYALRRAQQRRRGKAAKIKRLLERIALTRRGVDAVRVLIEKLRQCRGPLICDRPIAEHLHVRRHVAQGGAKARKGRRADDFDRGQLERLGRVFRCGGDRRRPACQRRHKTPDKAPLQQVREHVSESRHPKATSPRESR